MLQTEIISIFIITKHFYIHIPFCRQKCPYCKFALTPIFDEFKKKRYIEYLKKEIREYFSVPIPVCEFGESIQEKRAKAMNSGGLGRETVGVGGKKVIGGAELPSFSLPNSFGTFSTKSTSEIVSEKENTETDLSSSTGTGLCRDDKEVKTIYFGGGTPSILSIEEIREILECFPFYQKTEIEITLESNPEDITEEYIRSIVELGINRISVGVQTLNEKSLIEIHRSDRHSIAIALQNIKSFLFPDVPISVCEFGASVSEDFHQKPQTVGPRGSLERGSFSNSKNKSNTDNKMKHGRVRKLLLLLVSKVRILTQKYIIKNGISLNTDFILGLPYVQSGETLAGIKKLHTELPFITHTSVYMLEDDLYPKHWKSHSISEGELQSEFLEIIEYFQSIGWNHYELSNWAKPGYESVHNRAYWDHSNSRGFGLSSASYEDGKRWNNDESFVQYYRGNTMNRETITSEQVEIENMMFGLRTGGWDISRHTITTIQKIQKLIDNGLIEMDNHTIKPTKTGIFVIDYIMSELIDI